MFAIQGVAVYDPFPLPSLYKYEMKHISLFLKISWYEVLTYYEKNAILMNHCEKDIFCIVCLQSFRNTNPAMCVSFILVVDGRIRLFFA